jgi:hypothetical protein
MELGDCGGVGQGAGWVGGEVRAGTGVGFDILSSAP